MKRVACASIMALLTIAATPYAAAQDSDEEYSRGELFILGRTLEPTMQDYSLPSRFEFPKDARDGSVFGIDYSHHNCKCVIDWETIAANKVQFAYLKSSQGGTFRDTWFKENAVAASSNKLFVGAYHFLTANHTVEKQAANFLTAIEATQLQLAPTVDLEWDLGTMTDECPRDAQAKIITSSGEVQKCDLWSKYSATEIIAKVNAWIDLVGAKTGKRPALYTSAVWWSARIGKPERIKEIKASAIWIADYSKGAQATEQPRVPNNEAWHAWQFTDRASLPSKSGTLLMDASILQGELSRLQAPYP